MTAAPYVLGGLFLVCPLIVARVMRIGAEGRRRP